MQFLVETTPQAARPDDIRANQLALWRWLAEERKQGKVLHAWRKPGRGAVFVVEVESHDSLHALLQTWCNYVPATFNCTPLLPPPAEVWP